MYKITNNNIKYYRTKKSLSLKELSIRSNISSGYLSHLENGGRNNPSFIVMQKISIALDKSISEIFNI